MTAQISDTVRYRGKDFALAGINGFGLFDPIEHGVTPVGISTACYRGFYCTYQVADGGLLLIEVHLSLGAEEEAAAARGEGPALFGRIPRRYTQHGYRRELLSGKVETSWESDELRVDRIREPIAYTGGLLLGDDFIREMYVHMGFHPAYKFREVHELVFDDGRLIEEHDRSEQMAEFRAMLSPGSLEPEMGASREDIERWIERSFSQRYRGFGA